MKNGLLLLYCINSIGSVFYTRVLTYKSFWLKVVFVFPMSVWQIVVESLWPRYSGRILQKISCLEPIGFIDLSLSTSRNLCVNEHFDSDLLTITISHITEVQDCYLCIMLIKKFTPPSSLEYILWKFYKNQYYYYHPNHKIRLRRHIRYTLFCLLINIL